MIYVKKGKKVSEKAVLLCTFQHWCKMYRWCEWKQPSVHKSGKNFFSCRSHAFLLADGAWLSAHHSLCTIKSFSVSSKIFKIISRFRWYFVSCRGKKMHFESLVNVNEQSPNYHGRYLKFYNVFLEVLQINWLAYTFDKYLKKSQL